MGEFTDALILTTPHLTGQRVKDAQWLMAGHSHFGPGLAPYKDQPIDGDFGPLTAQASGRTKWWLGYPTSKCTPTFGQSLYDLLVDKTHLTPEMAKLRTDRLAQVTHGQKALEYARQFAGYTENPPGSNRTIFGEWYGFNGVPWCVIFLSYCFAHSGYFRFHYASVEQVYYDALANRNNLRIVWAPQPGDVVLYHFGGHEFAHGAFYDKRISATEFYDFAGNTGHTDQSNGGQVLRQKQITAIVKAYVRVG